MFAFVRRVGWCWQTQVENSLQLNLPNAAQADDFIVTTSDGPVVANTSRRLMV
jgi:hypothetical protein